MQCYCNKCGRKIVMTQGELNAQHGQVVCPQCLAVFTVPQAKGDNPPPVPAKSRKKSAADDNVPPVPHRKPQRQSAAAPRQRPAVRQSVVSASPVKPKATPGKATAKTSRKKPAAKKSLLGFGWNNMTPLGCLVLSVLIALVFFVFYYIIGQLLL